MIKKIFLFSIFTLVLIEFFSFVASKFNLLLINNDPEYVYSYGNKWRVENTPWGSWHKINFKDNHVSKCFNVTYQSNNVGARDEEDYDEKFNKDSIILLGDSFAEGFAVNFEDTFHQKLEKKINKNILNFGSAGHFGPLQSKIIYDQLAKKYKHNELIFMFFPHNDFLDNNWKYWKKKIRKLRNRPYLVKNKTSNEFEVFYPSENSKIDFFVKDLIFNKVQFFLIKYTYTANTLRTLNSLYENYFYNDKENKDRSYSLSYYYKEISSVESTMHSINSLLLSAGKSQKKTIIIIPTIEDLKRKERGEDYKNYLWFKKIQSLSKSTSTNLIDLADFLNTRDYLKMIYECDFHWNPKGHSFVADLIFEKIYN